MERIKNIFLKYGAASSGIIRYCDCEIINPGLAGRIGFTPKSVCIGTIPYYTKFCDLPRSLSSYALAYDYHALINQISEKIISEAKILFPNASFKSFCDHSPINEKRAAAKAGLGIIGEHSLLITPKYSSFVFIFELFTDIEYDKEPYEIGYCEKCGNCIRACPGSLSGKGDCLSAITQKKGALTKEEINMIIESGSVWGCDICQMACPHTRKAIADNEIYTDLKWFEENIMLTPDAHDIENAEDFKKRAYSWRGTNVILRNIEIINNSKTESNDND